MSWNADFTFIGSNGAASDLYLGTGAVSLSATRQVTVQNAATTLSVGGAISGTGFGLTKAGPGTLALSGANTYTGGSNINAGTLMFAKTNSMPASSTVAVNGATLGIKLGGTDEWTAVGSGSGTLDGLLNGIGGQGNTVTYSGNVTLGIDTSNGGDQSYGGAIGNVVGSTSLD